MDNDSPPRKLRRVVIKEELVVLLGDHVLALILNQFLYWSERTRDTDQFLQEERERDPGLKNVPLTFGWIYKIPDELREELMISCSTATIRRALEQLVELGYLSRRNDPKHKWNRTYQYRPDVLKIQRDLQEMGYALEGYPLLIEENPFCTLQNACCTVQNASGRVENASGTLPDRNGGNAKSIDTEITPENTPKNTSETTTDNSSGGGAETDAPVAAVADLSESEYEVFILLTDFGVWPSRAKLYAKCYTAAQVQWVFERSLNANDPPAAANGLLKRGDVPPPKPESQPPPQPPPELPNCPNCAYPTSPGRICPECGWCSFCCTCEPEPADEGSAAEPTPQAIWQTALGELQLQMTRGTFNTWLKPTRALSYQDGVLTIEVPNGYAQEWLEHRLNGTIQGTLAGILKQPDVEVQFVIEEYAIGGE